MREDFVRFGFPNELQKESLIYCDGMGFEAKPSFYVDRTGFNNYLIMYTISGELLCTQNSETVKVFPGEAVLIDLHQYHRYHFAEGVPSKIAWAHMNGKSAVTIMEQIQKYQTFPMKLRNPEIYRLFLELLFYRVSWEKSEGNAEDVRYKEFKSKVWEKIQHEFHRNISLEELAECVSLSKYHFLRTFEKAFGVTPMQFITDERIRQAKYRLLNTRESINSISDSLGFSSAGYFTKVFKKEIGMTPSEYREKSNILP